MTISSNSRKAGPYSGNDVATAFAFAFKVFSEADVLVVFTSASNAETVLTLTTDYTVTLNADQDTNPGGSVTLPAALVTGTKLTITSSVADLQPVTLTNNGGFYPRVINDALDRATIQIQQLKEKLGRALVWPISLPGATLPLPEASKFIGWNATADSLANLSGVAVGDAQTVLYTPAGSAAVATDVQRKLRESVSVKDFGAVGDGVTDDTAAIQAALDVGGRILVNHGCVFVVSSVLSIKSNTHLYGDGVSSAIKLAAGADAHMMQNQNYAAGSNENIVIDGVVFDGNVANQTNNGTKNKHGIRLKNVTGFELRNSEIKSVGTDAINLVNCTRPVIRHSSLWGAYNSAVVFENTHGLVGESNTVHDCGSKTDATGFTSAGHAFIGVNVACNNVRLVGNYVYDMGDSCLRNERAGEGWIISDNLVVNSGKDSIKIMGVVGSATKPKANVVAGNVIIDAGNCGIVANGDGTIVTNNSIFGTGKNVAGTAAGKWFDSAGGIVVLDNSSDVVVAGNYVREAYAPGISFAGGARGAAKGNTITACGTNGIEFVDHAGCVIEGNEVFDNGTLLTATYAGIRIQGTAASYSHHSVRHNRCYNTGATGHLWGIRLEGGANVSESLAQFNQLWGNTNAQQLFSNWSGAGNVISQNTGYKTENRGTATILAGNTSVVVLHGLSITPDASRLAITCLSDIGTASKFYATTPNSTQFSIGINAAQASDKNFAWQVLA